LPYIDGCIITGCGTGHATDESRRETSKFLRMFFHSFAAIFLLFTQDNEIVLDYD
jgi:hypothetical protein